MEAPQVPKGRERRQGISEELGERRNRSGRKSDSSFKGRRLKIYVGEGRVESRIRGMQ